MEKEPKLDIIELQEMFNDDQQERIDWQNYDQLALQKLQEKDQKRRVRVKQLVEEGMLQTGADYYHAAMVFQHGEKPDDYLKANELAKKAVKLGDLRGLWMMAASLDRYLTHTNQPFQKYGTQYRKIGDKFQLYPVDPDTTDEERAKFNVPSLEKLKEKEKELNDQNKS